MPTLSEIAGAIPGARMEGDGGVVVAGMTHDSREVEAGHLFAAVPGEKTDGARFVEQAVNKGAVALMCREVIETDLPRIVVEDPRMALGAAAAAVYEHPSRELGLAGVTGTNGKTTVAYMVEAAMKAAGPGAGVMGTVEYRYGELTWAAAHTTPEATVIQRTMRRMRDAGAENLVMEIPSHGPSLGRLEGCELDVAAFTNLTQDHLDFHGDMEAYAAAKMRLFTELLEDRPEATAVINRDDPFSAKILARLRRPAVTISCDPNARADVRPAASPRIDIDGIRADLTTPWGPLRLESPMLGEHNLNNALVAFSMAVGLGAAPEKALEGLAGFGAVPGRLERVPSGKDFAVLVDYAHTPDALRRVIAALARLTPGRLLCVFGCGGDRDATKRPIMGAAVGEGADVGIVTSDNPRTEEPGSIIEMIIPGIEGAGKARLSVGELRGVATGFAVEPDRATAIRDAIEAARPGDTVLIAGKGHEDYQILGTEKIHFDDREHAAEALRALARRGGEDG